MRTRTRFTALVPLLMLVAASAAGGEQPMLGSEAPDFRLESLDGESVALSDLQGSLVVLHFGAGW